MLSAQLIHAVVEATNDGVVVAEIKENATSIIFANPAFLQLSAYSMEEIQGSECLSSLQDSPDTESLQQFADALQHNCNCNTKLRLHTKNGKRIWVEVRATFLHTPENSYVICFYKDVTQEEYVKSVLDKVNILYREMSKRLEYTNETDHLTHLKNRGHLCTRGEFMLGAAKREKLRLHAISITVDNIRMVNAAGSPALGDDCLIRIAGVIRNYFCRATDIAIRMGDDEFAIICIEDDDQQVHDRAQALQRDVRLLHIKDMSGRQHALSVNIGIYSVTPEKHTTIEEMMQKAGELIFNIPDNGAEIIHNQAGDGVRPLHH